MSDECCQWLELLDEWQGYLHAQQERIDFLMKSAFSMPDFDHKPLLAAWREKLYAITVIQRLVGKIEGEMGADYFREYSVGEGGIPRFDKFQKSA